MKIAVLGAGAMGCYYGALINNKHDVTLVDVNREHVDTINRRGLTIIDGDARKTYTIKAALAGELKEAQDLVIVFVKNTVTDLALTGSSALFGQDTIVLTLQNGAGNDADIKKRIAPERVVIGTTKHNCVFFGPGEVRHSGSGLTVIGSDDASPETVNTAAKMLNESGIETTVSDDIQRIVWSKLFVNISLNAVTAALNVPIGFLDDDENAWRMAENIVREAVTVAASEGLEFDAEKILGSLKKTCATLKDGVTSMCQDRRRHAKTEIDRINGAVVAAGLKNTIPTPYNTMMVDLIHAIEGAYEVKE